jgi:hypothetical protein
MNEMINTLKGVVLLDEKTFQTFLASENTMKRGIFILLACFLVAALPAAIGQLIDNVQPFTPERAEVFQEEFLQGFEQIIPFLPLDENFQDFMEQFKENLAFGTGIAVAVDALPRPLPRAIGGFFQAFGGWLSLPFTHLASWMSYAIWVLLFAKITGGFGGVNRFLGITALYAVPNLLGFFNFIPVLGGVISFVGVIWGWIVYIKATEVSQEFTMSKAILVAILPVLVMIGAIFLIIILATIGLVGSAQ